MDAKQVILRIESSVAGKNADLRQALRLSALVFMVALVLSLFAAVSAQAQAENQYDGEEDVVGYDTIVRDLGREIAPAPVVTRARAPRSRDPFESIWIHGGIGVATVMQDLDFGDGQHIYLGQRGVQAALGIDLFSPNWMAEGTVRNFNEQADARASILLKEFELKILFKDKFSRQLGYHLGGGLAARYMTIRHVNYGTLEYTTPSSVASLGMDLFLSDRISLGAEMSARNTLISETIDRVSYDATLRLDTHF